MTINNHARVASFIVIGKFHFLSRIKVSFNFHLPLFPKWNGLKLRCKIPLRHNFISKGILNCYCAQLHLFCEKAATSIEIYHSIAKRLRDSDWKAKMIKTDAACIGLLVAVMTVQTIYLDTFHTFDGCETEACDHARQVIRAKT